MSRFIVMDPMDMVATNLKVSSKGEIAQVFSSENEKLCEIEVLEDIPFGNKIAIVDIKKGEKVIKYGGVIGESTKDIKAGELVHVHNVKSLVVDIPLAFKKEILKQMNIKHEIEV
ncbi:UxaA family hydrolase [Alkalibacter mobilis]|uniref:UxaA family hydrolase n=1 Tax=Alkalibacter mobilis TaxID=2787712 RepID=UPI00189DB7A0|nr:UxaA family hydrolase [Alkalibacter mobilis]MBF7096649.1 UxaA family hydrolase [Alkalibacter mobilis]